MGYKKDMSKYENLEGWERCGFGEQLDRWAEKYGERTAVTDSEDEISYMELKQKADCLAAAFLRKGILKGDKVLVQLPNRISFVIVFFALSKIGAVPIMMLPAHREAELEGIIELARRNMPYTSYPHGAASGSCLAILQTSDSLRSQSPAITV